ncbi:hypothetical protein EVAR_48382_1 [Eumeta japonica]|uniref:Uncharacterized protein n=1 Tax=Eumeta variegata TaxID=151549 RepID=A0A4C1ZEL8_EUMVA|nr:hypothetical protein EVAR_48382_1 [Eumeta japonica]
MGAGDARAPPPTARLRVLSHNQLDSCTISIIFCALAPHLIEGAAGSANLCASDPPSRCEAAARARRSELHSRRRLGLPEPELVQDLSCTEMQARYFTCAKTNRTARLC